MLNSADLDSLDLKPDGQCMVSLSGTINVLSSDVSGRWLIDAKNATIISIAGDMNGQSTIVGRDAADVKVETNKDSVIQRVDGN